MVLTTIESEKKGSQEFIYVVVVNFKGCTDEVRATRSKERAENIRKDEARRLLFTEENLREETGDYTDSESDVTLHVVPVE